MFMPRFDTDDMGRMSRFKVIDFFRVTEAEQIMVRVQRLVGVGAWRRLDAAQRERLERALRLRVKLRGSSGRVSDAEIEEEWEAVLLGVPTGHSAGVAVRDYFFPG